MKFIKKIIKKFINFLISEIINSINYQIKINPLHFYNFYEAKESYLKYKKNMKSVPLFPKGEQVREYSFKRLIKNFPNQNLLVIQLGVHNGKPSKHYSNLIKKFNSNSNLIGFDSWEGLSEDWIGMTRLIEPG